MPVDAYGVGSSLIRGSNDFTADIVMTGDEPSPRPAATRPTDRLTRSPSARRASAT